MWLQRDQRVLAAQVHDTIEIARLRNLSADEAIAQATQLEAIQIADEFVYELGSCRWHGVNAVSPELFEHILPIAIRHGRGVADG